MKLFFKAAFLLVFLISFWKAWFFNKTKIEFGTNKTYQKTYKIF